MLTLKRPGPPAGPTVPDEAMVWNDGGDPVHWYDTEYLLWY